MIDTAREHWRLILAPVLVLTAVLAAVGLLRQPVYESHSQLIIGKVDARIGGVSAFLTTTTSLGKGYTRLLYAEGVVGPTARRTGLSRAEVRERVRAVVDQTAPVVNVYAEGASAAEARELANAVSASMVRLINRSNRPDPAPEEALARFRRASTVHENLVDRLQAAERRLGNRANPPAAQRLALARLRADERKALLRMNALEVAYEASLSDTSYNLVRVLTKAEGASSDRRRILAFAVYCGLVAGAATGIGLVLLRLRRSPSPGRGAVAAGAG